MSKKYVGDPAFATELWTIADERKAQPISAEERAKLATPVTRPFAPLHKHEEDCWGEPFKRSIPAPNKGRGMFVTVMVQQCRRGGAIREVEDAT